MGGAHSPEGNRLKGLQEAASGGGQHSVRHWDRRTKNLDRNTIQLMSKREPPGRASSHVIQSHESLQGGAVSVRFTCRHGEKETAIECTV